MRNTQKTSRDHPLCLFLKLFFPLANPGIVQKPIKTFNNKLSLPSLKLALGTRRLITSPLMVSKG